MGSLGVCRPALPVALISYNIKYILIVFDLDIIKGQKNFILCLKYKFYFFRKFWVQFISNLNLLKVIKSSKNLENRFLKFLKISYLLNNEKEGS